MAALSLSALASRLHDPANGMGVCVYWHWRRLNPSGSVPAFGDVLVIQFGDEPMVEADRRNCSSWPPPPCPLLRLRAVLEEHGIRVGKARLRDAMALVPHTPMQHRVWRQTRT